MIFGMKVCIYIYIYIYIYDLQSIVMLDIFIYLWNSIPAHFIKRIYKYEKKLIPHSNLIIIF